MGEGSSAWVRGMAVVENLFWKKRFFPAPLSKRLRVYLRVFVVVGFRV
jgi:hypothetical protein